MRPTKLLWAGGTAAAFAGRNQFFKHFPRLGHGLMRLGGVTGRGGGREGTAAADYFEAVVKDYETIAAHTGVVAEPRALFRGRRVLELGLGNTRAVALLAKLHGAVGYEGLDAFDIQSRDARYLRTVYEPLLTRSGEEGGYARAEALLADVPVHHDHDALARAGRRFDLVISRAVLEHVADLDALFTAVDRVTTDDAVQIHKVDLRCHGNRFDHELDFLLFPEGVYQAMASHVGLPNRVRVPGYLDLGDRHGFALVYAGSTHRITEGEVGAIRDDLAPPFKAMPPGVLAVLGVWLVLARKGHPLAAGALRDASVAALPPAPASILSAY